MTVTTSSTSLSDLVIERVGFGLFVLDRAMNVLMWNRFMQDHSGVAAADVIGRNLFDSFPDLPRAWLARKLESVFQLGSFAFSSWEQRPYLFRFEHDRPITGGVDFMQQDCTFMPLTRGREVEAVCVTISDVTHVSVMQREREEAVAKLREHANLDGLTGIANRRFFEARLHDEYARWQRYGGNLSVLLFDLDHFKTINDRFGHAVGDTVLREMAQRVTAIVRAQDTFGRFGGEEFALLLPCTDLDEAMLVAEKVRCAISRAPVEAEGVSVPVTASVGAACARPGAPTFEIVVNEADAALYRAKRLGRDRSVAYV
ncbi:diguanylate cyclase [Burkholderia sp. Ac-20353]|uniref:sensor domain-containing diguanylate cyclase n=1 Tax=Burkholderia sp. Ac-20353 TaxID=2703894 RepID=UPI00197C7584|nr:diguanylate cyclase [Burkholderia sp. Ac-20353]MBN3786258.1 diguanylate cyclase [Burkholderia sp. Ac-20353]